MSSRFDIHRTYWIHFFGNSYTMYLVVFILHLFNLIYLIQIRLSQSILNNLLKILTMPLWGVGITLIINVCLKYIYNKTTGKMVIRIHQLLVRKMKKVVVTMLWHNLNFFLSGRLLAARNRRKKKIIINFSTTGWLLSVDTNVRKYVQQRFTSSERYEYEKTTKILYWYDVDIEKILIVSRKNLNNFKVIQASIETGNVAIAYMLKIETISSCMIIIQSHIH